MSKIGGIYSATHKYRFRHRPAKVVAIWTKKLPKPVPQ